MLTRDTDVPWYSKELENLSDPTRKLLQTYSGIAPDQIIPHIYKVDIRKLVSDGVPSENCYGADLRLDLIDTGYDLFKDKETLKFKFIAADILDDNSELNQLDCQIDIVHAASFLHLFDWTDQMSAAKRIVKLLKPQTGSLTIGRQVGNVTAGEQPRRVENGSRMFRHNEESFRRFWAEVGDDTGTQWEVDVKLMDWTGPLAKRPEWVDSGVKRLQFMVKRL
ncbi:hypothetical protein B0A49_04383 [Cryomyces minteri]|uniref:Methyltransferase type 11 domain-containing protein n=1 Tax=Cryomyces minteri TaxID=331657 RepID=A0A4V5NFF4_9PEZI|nr:hypothetical protein B0A49_04383 [Cryomyces minteri]